MAVTIQLYNNAVKRLVNKEVSLTNLKFMLLDNTASFNAAHTTLAQVMGGSPSKEVFGNNWTLGGELLENVAVTIVDTNDAMLDADDISKTATGGPIGPAYAGVLYDDADADDAPLAYVDFGTDEQAGQDTDFKVVWGANGIFRFVYSPS